MSFKMSNKIYNNASLTTYNRSQFALAFYQWMKQNDTQENAEKWCQYSDEDMFEEFQKLYVENLNKHKIGSTGLYDDTATSEK